MSSIWSFLTSWTNSVDDFRKNNTIGGWGGPATVWNPKMAAKSKPKATECDTDIADLTGKPPTNSSLKKQNNESDEMIAELVVANSMH